MVRSTRSGLIEKTHRGSVCLVNEKDEPVFSLGDVWQMIFPRSAMKYFQVLPLLESGAADEFGFTDQEIAVMCASHNAEDVHLEFTRSILKKAGLDESVLRCGPHSPMNPVANENLILSGRKPTGIHNNCSGKHAGFLALAKFLGAPVKTYLMPESTVQVLVRRTVSEMCRISEDKLFPGIDGCSAPNYGMPLINLAIGFKNLGTPKPENSLREEACKRVIRAVTSYPYMVGGKDRYCTEMMEVCGEKIIGKLGADGIYGLGFHALKMGAAIKIDDGSTGPQYCIAQNLIQSLKIFPAKQTEALRGYLESEILNCNGIRTGFTTPSPDIFSAIKI